jgi:hypothetical protein
LQDNDRPARLVVGGIEPVAKVEEVVAVRLVTALVVEVVHGYGEVVCWVELAGVDILALNKRRGYAFRLCDSQLGITPKLILALSGDRFTRTGCCQSPPNLSWSVRPPRGRSRDHLPSVSSSGWCDLHGQH